MKSRSLGLDDLHNEMCYVLSRDGGQLARLVLSISQGRVPASSAGLTALLHRHWDNVTHSYPELGHEPFNADPAQILFERPGVIGRFRGYHRQVCHTDRVKSAAGDRYLSAWQHLTDEELENQYQLLDSYKEGNFDWIPRWLLEMLVPHLTTDAWKEPHVGRR